MLYLFIVVVLVKTNQLLFFHLTINFYGIDPLLNSCQGYELWQQARFVYIHLKDNSLIKFSRGRNAYQGLLEHKA